MRQKRTEEIRFLACFGSFLALGGLAFIATLMMLRAAGSLPAPPLTGTYCIDEKFKFLAEREIRDVDLLAVGSSVTWRNLDLTPFESRGLSSHPLNAAPCYLNFHQTAFLTEFLLEHLGRVKTVLSVVAPRDFADCDASDRAFFDPDQAEPYVFEDSPPLYIYATNFRPMQLFRDASQVASRRSAASADGPLVMGPYGAGPIEGNRKRTVAPTFDDACFEALRGLESKLAAQGVALVIVSFPMSPRWRSRHDPDGSITAEFEKRIQEVLQDESTIVVPSAKFRTDGALYYDDVHFRWQGSRDFSRQLASLLAPVLSRTEK
jgi:hypothetical protein